MKRTGLFIAMLVAGLRLMAQSTPALTTDSLKFLSNKNKISTFLKLVDSCELNNIFTDKPITIFIPDDKAFEHSNLSGTKDKAAVLGLINDHSIAGILTAKSITQLIGQGNGTADLVTVSGRKYKTKINPNRNIILVDEFGVAYVVKVFDIHYKAVIIFIIDSVIPAKE